MGSAEMATSIAVPGQRNTKQRAAVIELLVGNQDFQSAQDLHGQLRGRGEKIGLATVYRSLQALASAGTVDTVRRDDGETLYRLCGDAHEKHHHLVCLECGKTVEVIAPEIGAWAEKIAAKNGFSDASPSLEIHARCGNCSLGLA